MMLVDSIASLPCWQPEAASPGDRWSRSALPTGRWPKDVGRLIGAYAATTKEEGALIAMIDYKNLKRRRKGARVAGALITWPRRDDGLPYWQRRYTVSFGAQTTRVVTFGQLLPGGLLPWVYSLPDPEAAMFDYERVHLPMLINWLERPHLGIGSRKMKDGGRSIC